MSALMNCKTGLNSIFDEKKIVEVAKAGIEVIEYDSAWNDEDCDVDYSKIQKQAENCGIYMQSIHLAMGERMDLSHKINSARTLDVMKKQILKASNAGVKYAVLHLSSEPILDGEREDRLNRAIENAINLLDYADGCGVELCVEDLPRTCLCNSVREIKRVLSADDRFKVCFDVNHLFKDSHKDFINAFSDKIVTTHISDYNFLDDCHFIPGDGKINWLELKELFESINYSGAFLYECNVLTRKFGCGALPYSAYKTIHENISNGVNPLLNLDNTK